MTPQSIEAVLQLPDMRMHHVRICSCVKQPRGFHVLYLTIWSRLSARERIWDLSSVQFGIINSRA